MFVPIFCVAAVGGFALMAVVGIQALIALLSSVPLAKRRYRKNPEFNLGRAYHRIFRIIVLSVGGIAIGTALVLHFAPTSGRIGYLFGMILSFVLSIRRMSPNNAQNQEMFSKMYADCEPGEDRPDAMADTVSLTDLQKKQDCEKKEP